jgi:hypothetical protein
MTSDPPAKVSGMLWNRVGEVKKMGSNEKIGMVEAAGVELLNPIDALALLPFCRVGGIENQ